MSDPSSSSSWRGHPLNVPAERCPGSGQPVSWGRDFLTTALLPCCAICTDEVDATADADGVLIAEPHSKEHTR